MPVYENAERTRENVERWIKEYKKQISWYERQIELVKTRIKELEDERDLIGKSRESNTPLEKT